MRHKIARKKKKKKKQKQTKLTVSLDQYRNYASITLPSKNHRYPVVFTLQNHDCVMKGHLNGASLSKLKSFPAAFPPNPWIFLPPPPPSGTLIGSFLFTYYIGLFTETLNFGKLESRVWLVSRIIK